MFLMLLTPLFDIFFIFRDHSGVLYLENLHFLNQTLCQVQLKLGEWYFRRRIMKRSSVILIFCIIKKVFGLRWKKI